MATNLLEAVTSQISPAMIGQLSRLLGESESNVSRGVTTAAPAILAALSKVGSTPEGASQILRSIETGETNGSAVAAANSALASGGGSLESFLRNGEGVARSFLGERMSTVVQAIASATGLQGGLISKILSFITPVVMSVIGREVKTSSLGVSGLQSLFAGQRDYLSSALPSGIASVVSSLGAVAGTGRAAAQYGTQTASRAANYVSTRESSWFSNPLALLAGIIALGTLGWWLAQRGAADRSLRSQYARTQQEASELASEAAERSRAMLQDARTFTKRLTIRLPDGISLSVPEGSLEQRFARYLADPGSKVDQNSVFQFDRLVFDTNSATLNADSNDQLDNLTRVFLAYPSVNVAIGGHTDNVGDPQANLALSEQRAQSVKSELIRRGINDSRIAALGHGDRQPIASNSTETGRAMNRRIDITVTAK